MLIGCYRSAGLAAFLTLTCSRSPRHRQHHLSGHSGRSAARARRRRSARLSGLRFAAITRVALLCRWCGLARLRTPLFTVFGEEISVRDLALARRRLSSGRSETRKRSGTCSGIERRGPETASLQRLLADHPPGGDHRHRVLVRLGVHGHRAVQHIEVMVAAIVVSVRVMMVVSAASAASSIATRRSRRWRWRS